MKKTKILLKILFIVILLISCSKNNDNEELIVINGLELEILYLVNIHRDSLGLLKVSNLNAVYLESLGHTNYMIIQGKTSHDNFKERSRNLMASTNAKIILENVGAGYNTADSLMKAWLNSKLHKENIENPNVQFIGISAKQNTNNTKFYTQIFIGK